MKRKYHLNFSEDSQFPSETHSYKLPPYRDSFNISADLNRLIFVLIFNRLAVHRYITNYNWISDAGIPDRDAQVSLFLCLRFPSSSWIRCANKTWRTSGRWTETERLKNYWRRWRTTAREPLTNRRATLRWLHKHRAVHWTEGNIIRHLYSIVSVFPTPLNESELELHSDT